VLCAASAHALESSDVAAQVFAAGRRGKIVKTLSQFVSYNQ